MYAKKHGMHRDKSQGLSPRRETIEKGMEEANAQGWGRSKLYVRTQPTITNISKTGSTRPPCIVKPGWISTFPLALQVLPTQQPHRPMRNISLDKFIMQCETVISRRECLHIGVAPKPHPTCKKSTKITCFRELARTSSWEFCGGERRHSNGGSKILRSKACRIPPPVDLHRGV